MASADLNLSYAHGITLQSSTRRPASVMRHTMAAAPDGAARRMAVSSIDPTSRRSLEASARAGSGL
jgi:hypothetical protein